MNVPTNTPTQLRFPMPPAQLVAHLTTGTPRIHLPPIQRDVVWRSQQVCDLWDSLMRGIPLPSLVLQKIPAQADPIGARIIVGGSGEGSHPADVSVGDYWLLDGQQRANAIYIGFAQESKTHRLWLDLGWPSGERGRRFGFFLCSTARPWGDAADLSSRPGAQRVCKAREEIEITDGCFDFQISLTRTWPVAAALPIPFAPLLQWAISDTITMSITTLQAKIAEIAQTLPTPIQTLIEAQNHSLAPAIWEALLAGLQRVTTALITAIEASMDDDDLLEAFTRLNRNGTRLTDSELFFAALKKSMPHCQELVNTTCQKERQAFGTLDVVRAFTVLATAETTISSTTLNLELFKTINRSGKGLFQKHFEPYLASFGDTSAACLLQRTIDTLRYTEGQDKGLPEVMIPRLGVRTWLPVLRWLECWGANMVAPDDRNNMLRFVLVDHFFADWQAGEDKLLRSLLQLIEESVRRAARFPTLAEIESHLDTLRTGLHPSAWLKRVDFPHSDFKNVQPISCPLSLAELQKYRSRCATMRSALPHLDWYLWLSRRSHDMLLWSQRAAMKRWFGSFLPALGLLGDTGRPWDIDHIVPSSFFDGRTARFSNGASEADVDVVLREKMHINGGTLHTFRFLGDFVGNKRALPLGFNRSDQDKSVSAKFPENPQEISKHRVLADWWNQEVVDQGQELLAKASAMDFSQELWCATPKKAQGWDQSAIHAFPTAVITREDRLYGELFDFLKDGFAPDRFTHRVS